MIARNLSGALDLILGRETGMQKLDLTADGFWRSFVGLGMAGIIDAVALYAMYPMRAKVSENVPESAAYLVWASLLVAGLAYLASMTALYFLCRTPEVQQRFPNAVVANNWASPVVSIGFVPVAFVSVWLQAAAHPNPPGVVSLLLIVTAIAVLVTIGIRLLRISLDIPQSQAVALFIATAAVSWILEAWLMNLFGLG